MAHGFFDLVEGEGRRGEGPSKPPLTPNLLVISTIVAQ